MTAISLLALLIQAPQEEPAQARRQAPEVDSATRTGLDPFYAPLSIDLLERADFIHLGVRFLPDLLRSVTGMEYNRPSSTEFSLGTRGFNDDSSASQGIHGYHDRRQIYNDFFGAVIWDSIPVTLDEVEKIEVIRGPGSFLHGPNALHGLVNIVTKNPLKYDNHEFILHAELGTYESNLETLVYVRKEGSSALKVKLAHDDIAEFEDEDARPNAKNKTFLELRFESAFEEAGTLDVTGGLSRQRVNTLIPPFSVPPAVVLEDSFRSELREGYLNAVYTLGDLLLRSSWTRWLADNVPDSARLGVQPIPTYIPFTVDHDAADVELLYTRKLGPEHLVTVGSGYRYSTFVTDAVTDGRNSTSAGWAFVQDQFTPADNLWITLGVRWDDHSRTRHSIAPRAAVVWEFVDDHVLRASYGEGFRNPSLRELWLVMPTGLDVDNDGTNDVPGLVTGNLELEPEHLRSVEAGYRGRLPHKITVSVAAYYNRLDDLINFVGPLPQNSAKAESFGLETGVTWDLTRTISAFANYSATERRDGDSNERNPGAPRFVASGGIRLTSNPGFSGSLWVSAIDDVEFVDPAGVSLGAVDGYLLLNARLSHGFQWEKVRGSLFVQAFNALDHDHREHPSGDEYGLLFSAGAELTW
jgi:iron complex outermembrane receptor protein